MVGSIPPDAVPNPASLRPHTAASELSAPTDPTAPAAKVGSILAPAHAALNVLNRAADAVRTTLNNASGEQTALDHFRAAWQAYLKDPTEAHLKTFLNDFFHMNRYPQQGKLIKGMFQDLGILGPIEDHRGGKLTLVQLNSVLKRDLHARSPRGVGEIAILEQTSLEGITNGARDTLPTLVGSATTILNALAPRQPT